MKILIVDDDRDDAAQLYNAIVKHSPLAECRKVYDGPTARRELQSFFPDFMFIEAIMFPVNGKDILRDATQRPALSRTKFIVLSHHLLHEDYAVFADLGASNVLAKVPNSKALALLVHKILAPAVVDIHIKVFTDDTVVHQQTAALEELLNRHISFDIALNIKNIASNIQFLVSQDELEEITLTLGYPVQRRQGGYWLPNVNRSDASSAPKA